MKIIITGTSSGIGRRAAVRFIEQDHFVYGIDSQDPSIASPNYVHFKVDIRDALNLPEITDADVLINNAGTQNSGADIEINLKGTINVTEAGISISVIWVFWKQYCPILLQFWDICSRFRLLQLLNAQ